MRAASAAASASAIAGPQLIDLRGVWRVGEDCRLQRALQFEERARRRLRVARARRSLARSSALICSRCASVRLS